MILTLRKNRSQIFLTVVFLFITSCATYSLKTKDAQNSFFSGDFNRTAQLLEKSAYEDGKDQLLYLLDRGMALQLSGDFKSSIRDFLVADKMVEIKDYTSISEETAAIVVNDNLKPYKGEDFEKVMVNAYLAINYLLNDQFEDALVECRRVNHKLHLYKTEAKRDYEQNPFARYLAGVIWEASGKYDDAYIDYKETFKIFPEFHYLKTDLVKWSQILDRPEDLKKWRKRFGDVTWTREPKNSGEVIVIFQQGKSAVKRPHPTWPRLPKFYPQLTTTQTARVEIDGVKSEVTQRIYGVSDTAIKNLDDAYAGLVAKGLLAVAAKEVLADQVRQKNETLGALTWLGLRALDQADLRYWTTLPESIQMARITVPPGSHEVKIVGLDASHRPSGEEKKFQINVLPRRKAFLNWRSLK